VTKRTRIDLPPAVQPPYDVFVNGVPQVEGRDYEAIGSSLFFERPIEQEGKLGIWKWARMFFGIAGSYGKNDSVDVAFTLNGRRTVATLVPTDVAGPEPTAPSEAPSSSTLSE